MLGSYVASPIQITAQEVLAPESISEQIVDEPQQLEDELYTEGEETGRLIELEETDGSALIPEMSDNVDEEIMFSEELIEESSNVSDDEDDEVAADIEAFSADGYSHVETSPGVVVVTTPSDATLANLVTYLEEHFLRTDIQSLTVHGMVDTGAYSGSDVVDGILTTSFIGISYLEFVDLEIVGRQALNSVPGLTELYLPKATTIGERGIARNSQLKTINAPLVEVVEANAFWDLVSLEVLIMPNWQGVSQSSAIMNTVMLKEISTGGFESTFPIDAFPSVKKQTINTTDGVLSQNTNYIIFPSVRELTVTGARTLYAGAFRGYPESVKYLSSDTLRLVNLTDFVNLESIDFDERLTSLWPNAFRGTKIETLRLSNVVLNLRETSFAGAEYLREVYLPRVSIDHLPDTLDLPNSLEIIGTTSDRLDSFQGISNDNPSVLFAATESNESLPLEDKQIIIGETEILETDLSNYILNEDLSQTAFELNQNWFFENELIGNTETYAITNMNQSNVGAYHYSVNIIPTGEATYSGSRESRKAQIDIVNEISFTSDFSVNSVIGELKNLEILFTSNITNMNTSFQIVVPESLKVDAANIEVYLDNASSYLPLGATVTIEDSAVIITNFPLLSGFNYHINIPIMPIAVSEQNEEIKIDFLGNFDPLEISGEVMIASGEFNVSIPDQINFEETSLNFSSIQSVIQKVNPLDIEITSFTAQEESWEIMVSATPFMNTENQEIGEEAIRLVYKENGDMHSLSEEISLAKGSFSGKLDYDFQTDAWSNTSHILTELEEEGLHVLVGNDYYKLESQQSYTTEVTFTIQYSP